MNIYERIQGVCAQKEITIYALEKNAGLTRNSIHSWKSSTPSADKVLRVAQSLDISTDYLLGNSDNQLSHRSLMLPDEILLLEAYKQLHPPHRFVTLTISFMKWLNSNLESE